MIPEECISECIKHKDRLYQIVQENMAQVQKKKEECGNWIKERLLSCRLGTDAAFKSSWDVSTYE